MNVNLPVIDFSDFYNTTLPQRLKIGTEIDKACKEYGFFYLTKHSIDPQLLEQCFIQAKVFFDQDDHEKENISIDRSAHNRGWFRMYQETLDPKKQPKGDIKEGIKIGNDLPPSHPLVQDKIPLHGPNQWPNLPDWQNTMQQAYNAFSELGRQLMQGFALGLNLPEYYFDAWINKPAELMATLSPLRYPPLKQGYNEISAGAHTDFGCFSILVQDQDGLEIKTPQGEWKIIPHHPDYLIINIGDMLSLWTQNIYTPTLHRVINRTDHDRHSIVFFFDPAYNTPLASLPNSPYIPPPHKTALEHLCTKIDASLKTSH